ncbi:MAG: acyl carrier protein [Alphaproteobacteria bacterium]|nr:MAG: acyl carrier protein [Alphaproteobacteria bacterium]
MTEDQILAEISKAITQIMSDKGLPAPTVTADTELLGGELPIDSLDLAMLVREMEERVGFDPFQDGFIDFRTAGEMAKLYVK